MGLGRRGLSLFPEPVSLFDEGSLIMANVRALALIGFLVTLDSAASIAMPPQEVPGGKGVQGNCQR